MPADPDDAPTLSAILALGRDVQAARRTLSARRLETSEARKALDAAQDRLIAFLEKNDAPLFDREA